MDFNTMLSKLHSFTMCMRKNWLPTEYIYYDEVREDIFNQDGQRYKFTIHDFIDEGWEEWSGIK